MKTFLITTVAEKIPGTNNYRTYNMAIKAKTRAEAKKNFIKATGYKGEVFALPIKNF